MFESNCLRRSILLACLLIPSAALAQGDEMLATVWNGVQQAQNKHENACGKITETRTSKLIAHPMVLRGHFCAAGLDNFMLEYGEPAPMRIRYSRGTLNITAGEHTEAMEVGKSVKRAQDSFSREGSIENLKRTFIVTVQEEKGDYLLKLVPRTEIFRRRINYISVKLSKQSFLPRQLEVDGTSGVNSVFAIEITSLNSKIPPETFEVQRPR